MGSEYVAHFIILFTTHTYYHRMKPLLFSIFLTIGVLALIALSVLPAVRHNQYEAAIAPIDTVLPYPVVIAMPPAEPSLYDSLAASLGIEVEAMMAVSSIESGRSHKAFISGGSPVVNVEVPMFKKMLHKEGYNVDSLVKAIPAAFKRPDCYADMLAAQRAMFRAASSINDSIAKLCTYWGMYQIRGSNWALCGTNSIDEFVKAMSHSEEMQHRLFANYLKNTGLNKLLQAKDWKRFARAYNGEGYARNQYDVKLAEAYKRYKQQ